MRSIAWGLALVLSGCGREAPAPVDAGGPTVAKPVPTVATRAPRASREAASESREPAAPRLENLVRADDTFDRLHDRYGDALVREKIAGAEGDEITVWVLYPRDASRRVEIYPDDRGVHPASLSVGDAATWARADGVRIGLTTAELARLNGGAFVFSGFGWDYGGAVTDWKGGRLAHGGRFVGPVQLCPPEDAPPGYPEGDGEFESTSPILASHPARVCRFGVDVATPQAVETR